MNVGQQCSSTPLSLYSPPCHRTSKPPSISTTASFPSPFFAAPFLGFGTAPGREARRASATMYTVPLAGSRTCARGAVCERLGGVGGSTEGSFRQYVRVTGMCLCVCECLCVSPCKHYMHVLPALVHVRVYVGSM